MKYTVRDLHTDFPDEQACLAWLVEWLYPDGITCQKCGKITKHYPMKTRKSYSCGICGKHTNPCANTIFHKSRTPLTIWFHAFYMLSTNKGGISAAQFQRETGVTNKCAHRILRKVREMMAASEEPLKGEVEVDETYIHANVFKRSSAMLKYGPTGQRMGEVIFAALERGGNVKVFHVPTSGERILTPIIRQHVKPGSLIHSDGHRAYMKLPNWGYHHRSTNHSLKEFYREDSHIQTLEGFFSTWKPRMKGTHKSVSSKYLLLYAQEWAWRYSNRDKPSVFWSLMGRVTND
jgi:transposase